MYKNVDSHYRTAKKRSLFIISLKMLDWKLDLITYLGILGSSTS